MTTLQMQRSRQVIAVTLVAAALCADRVAVAAPVLRPQHKATAAERLVTRLTTSFRRVIPAVKVIAVRCDGQAVEFAIIAPEDVSIRPQPISPFEFRLPPPVA
jgi:hypothetical protein